jgi:hypothetical protein
MIPYGCFGALRRGGCVGVSSGMSPEDATAEWMAERQWLLDAMEADPPAPADAIEAETPAPCRVNRFASTR